MEEREEKKYSFKLGVRAGDAGCRKWLSEIKGEKSWRVRVNAKVGIDE